MCIEIWQQETACEPSIVSPHKINCPTMHHCVYDALTIMHFNFLGWTQKLAVKVGDFGLARHIYSSDYYRANEGARIPVKWMAPETLHDAISNEKTDVVS